MDFRKNYVKFADPAFDGEPVAVKEFGENDPFTDDDDKSAGEGLGRDDETGNDDGWINGNNDNDGEGEDVGDDEDGKKKGKRKKLYVDGVPVTIVNEMVEYMDVNGNLITMSIIDYSRNNLRRIYTYFEKFREVWLAQKKKEELLQRLVSEGVFIDYVKETLPQENVDDYDVLSYIGYDIEPLTKDERIDRILASGYLDHFPPDNQDIIRLLLEAYRSHDIDELTNMRILNMPEFIQKGSPPAIVNGFGGREKYMEMLEEIEQQIYSA